MSAPLDMVEEFRKAWAEPRTTVCGLLESGSWTVPQVRAVACQLAISSPEEALAILYGVRKFEVGE